jgi:large subunit ribosomal protein L28
MKQCQITGVRPHTGHRYHRSGLAKKKGGIGRHLTKRVKRTFFPNLHDKRIWVPELNDFVKVRLTCHAMRIIDRRGAYSVLKEAGLLPKKPYTPPTDAKAPAAKATKA